MGRAIHANMQLSFGQVEQLLRHLHGVTKRRQTMLRSRLQHLQKEDLPPGVAIGRGTRFQYGVDETFMIVVALELARARMTAGHAARVVKANWPTLRAIVNEGLSISAVPRDRRETLPARWAVIAADGLSLLRQEQPIEDALLEIIGDTPGVAVAAWAQRLTLPPATTILIVDVLARVVQSADFLIERFGVDFERQE